MLNEELGLSGKAPLRVGKFELRGLDSPTELVAVAEAEVSIGVLLGDPAHHSLSYPAFHFEDAANTLGRINLGNPVGALLDQLLDFEFRIFLVEDFSCGIGFGVFITKLLLK